MILERTYLIEIFPRRGAIVSEMSAQQVKVLFDTNVMVLGHIVQRISETWRVNEAEQLFFLISWWSLTSDVLKSSTMRFLNI